MDEDIFFVSSGVDLSATTVPQETFATTGDEELALNPAQPEFFVAAADTDLLVVSQ